MKSRERRREEKCDNEKEDGWQNILQFFAGKNGEKKLYKFEKFLGLLNEFK